MYLIICKKKREKSFLFVRELQNRTKCCSQFRSLQQFLLHRSHFDAFGKERYYRENGAKKRDYAQDNEHHKPVLKTADPVAEIAIAILALVQIQR